MIPAKTIQPAPSGSEYGPAAVAWTPGSIVDMQPPYDGGGRCNLRQPTGEPGSPRADEGHPPSYGEDRPQRMRHRFRARSLRPADGDHAASEEQRVLEFEPGELTRIFVAPPWLRDAGLVAWLI